MLITPEYRKLNEELHDTKTYGANGHWWCREVLDLMTKYRCDTLLDYGAGKGTLGLAMKQRGHSWVKTDRLCVYDPGVPDWQDKYPCDMVVALDVLEHIEPDCLEDVLIDIRENTGKCFFATIATRAAKKKLPDGRNAHLIVREWRWWLEQLDNHFLPVKIEINYDRNEVYVECQPL